MKEYNVYSLCVIKVNDMYFICRNNCLNDYYTEILTGKKIKHQDKMEIEPLSKYYSVLTLKKDNTNQILMLSKEQILYKYLEINNKLDLEQKEIYDSLFDYEFPELKINQELKNDVKNNPLKYQNCDYRIKNGMFRTDEEKEKYIQENLKRPLPGKKQKFDVLAIPFNRPYVVSTGKAKELLNSKPDPKIREQIEKNAKQFAKQLNRNKKR